MTEEDEVVHEETPEQRKRAVTWLIVALVGAVLAGVLLASSVWDNKWKDDANAVGNELVQNKAGIDPQSWCAAQTTYDAIRRELFRRAAEVRGNDEQSYTRLADFALLRMNGPVARGIDDRLHSVTCSATAFLDLPPGVMTSGGQHTLSTYLEYMVQPAADGTGNVVRLGNADSIVVPLATLSRMGAPESAPLVAPEMQNEEVAEPEQPEQPDSGQSNANSPSFDCNNARTGSEAAVCSDPGLASLDRDMAWGFNRAFAQATPDQRRLLLSTRDRFLAYRDRCNSRTCISNAYVGRMREIRDIMNGDWEPPR